MSFYGIGITGDTAYLSGQIAAASPDITTQAQLTVAKWLDPLDETFVGVSFVDEIPAVDSGVDLTLYIDKSGWFAYLEEKQPSTRLSMVRLLTNVRPALEKPYNRVNLNLLLHLTVLLLHIRLLLQTQGRYYCSNGFG